MPTGKQRIPAAIPLFAALIVAIGAALWPGSLATPTPVSASATAEISGADVEPVAATNGRSAGLTREIKGIIRRGMDQAAQKGAERADCRVSVLVKELGVEGPLVEVDADRAMKPASNLKLATTAVALALLGADAHFETVLQSAVAPAGDVLAGDLIVRAGGDPLYVEGLHGEVAPLLAPLVEELKGEGVGLVTGDLVLDLGVFGEAQPAPGWPSAGQHWKDYCALSSGFTANAGCITLRVTPGAPLRPATVEITPRGHGAKVDVSVKTLKRGGALDLKAVITPDLIKVWGDIPADVKEWTSRYAHPDPVGLFGDALLLALEEGGVTVRGEARLERGVSGGVTLATLSTPILDSLIPINTHSNNAVADQLFLKSGADGVGAGDRSGGSAAALKALTQLGLEAEAYKQVDGSGLSRNNRISARQIVTLLDAVVCRGDVGSEAFMSSLALAGESGTLAERMNGTVADSMVRAKTGFIAGTSALSGVAMTDDERFFCFSVLVEYPALAGLNRQVWKPMQDGICEAIVRGP